MNVVNPNDDTQCEVCWNERSVYIPLITCTHSHTFCERCIKGWLAGGHSTCPKCRAIWPIQDCVSKEN
jgi:hypothetical protein